MAVPAPLVFSLCYVYNITIAIASAVACAINTQEVIPAFAGDHAHERTNADYRRERLGGRGSRQRRKNTAVAVIPAMLLSNDPCTIENLPDIEDVHALVDILRSLGAKVTYVPGEFLTVDPRSAEGYEVSYRDSQRLRASYYLIGALLGRCGKARVASPGGCEIGSRPIDQHLKGFMSLGAEAEERGGMINARCDALTGGDVFLIW